jgi:hypothetical protein
MVDDHRETGGYTLEITILVPTKTDVGSRRQTFDHSFLTKEMVGLVYQKRCN